jgi:membrane protein required for colicin V production
MIIDIFFSIALLLGAILGYSKGLIGSLFSFVGWFLGLAIAIKWSHNVSLYLDDNFHTHSRLMPFVAFLVLFVAVIIIVQLLSKLLEKSFSTIGLGFMDKGAGMLVWCFTLLILLSTMLWFADQMQWIALDVKTTSGTYKYIAPIAPYVFDGLGKLIPWFKDLFLHLQHLIGSHTPPPPKTP